MVKGRTVRFTVNAGDSRQKSSHQPEEHFRRSIPDASTRRVVKTGVPSLAHALRAHAIIGAAAIAKRRPSARTAAGRAAAAAAAAASGGTPRDLARARLSRRGGTGGAAAVAMPPALRATAPAYQSDEMALSSMDMWINCQYAASVQSMHVPSL